MVERDTVNILINVRFILRASQTICTNTNVSLGCYGILLVLHYLVYKFLSKFMLITQV